MQTKNIHKWHKTALSLLIAMAMIFSMLPVSAFAQDDAQTIVLIGGDGAATPAATDGGLILIDGGDDPNALDECICPDTRETKCNEDEVNTDCPVCAEHPEWCLVGVEGAEISPLATRSTALSFTSSSATDYSMIETEGWAWYKSADDEGLGFPAQTLLLNGLNLSVASGNHALTVPAGTTIILADGSENSIVATSSDKDGINVPTGNLTIQGTGSLDVAGAANGINAVAPAGSLTIDGGNITCEGNTAGLFLAGGFTIDGGNITCQGGAAGLYVMGNFTMNGGELTASGTSNSGIYSNSTPTINVGTIVAKSSGAKAFYNDYTVPNGGSYWVNTSSDSDPGGEASTSNGSFVINDTYKYAKIIVLGSIEQRTTQLDLSTNANITYKKVGGTVTINPTTTNVTNSNEGWKWYANANGGYAAKTLVLDGINLVAPNPTGYSIEANTFYPVLILPADATIVLADGSTNVITNSGTTLGAGMGIFMNGNLTIKGEGGELTVTAGSTTNVLSSGLYTYPGAENSPLYALTVESGTVAFIAANAYNNSSGISNIKTINVEGGSLTAEGKTASADGSASYGMYNLSTLSISGGTVTASGNGRALLLNYTVPNGYKYWVNETNAPSNTELTGNGTNTTIGSSHKYAKITYGEADDDGCGDDDDDIVPRTKALDLTASSVEKEDDSSDLGNPTSGNIDALAAEGWKWEYPAKILTLDGLDLSVSDGDALKVPAGTTIVLADGSENIIANNDGAGIYAIGALTINETSGTGKLTVSGTASYSGIEGGDGSTDFTMNGGVLNTTGRSGIEYFRNFIMNRGELNATGRSDYGISILGTFTMSGGTVKSISEYVETGAFNKNFTVPTGYSYWVSETTTPSTTELTSDGSAVIGLAYKYAKISDGEADDGGDSDVAPRTKALDLTASSVEKEDDSSDLGNPTSGSIDALDTEGWAWEYPAKILTLDGLDLAVSGDYALTVPDGTTIVLADESTNMITTNVGAGIKAQGALTINGDTGSLSVSNTNASGSGIKSDNNAAAFTMNGGALEVSSATGIDYFGNLIMNGGELKATGTAGNGLVIYGVLTMTGGTIEATGATRAIRVDYTVPNGYKYWVSETTDPSTDELTGDGSNTTIGSSHKYAKISVDGDDDDGEVVQRTKALNLTVTSVEKETDGTDWGDPTSNITIDALSSEGWKWEYPAKILTLNDLDATFNNSSTATVLVPDGTTIVLADGSINKIAKIGPNGSALSASANGAITIQGTGSLEVTSGGTIGIMCSNLTVENGTITATGDTNGVALSNGSGGVFSMSGGTLKATGGATGSGIHFQNTAASTFSFTGGTIEAKGGARAIAKDYIVPTGYKYWVNTSAAPGGTETISGGSFTIGNSHKYAKIVVPDDDDDDSDIVQRTKALDLTVTSVEKETDGSDLGNPTSADIDALDTEGWKWEFSNQVLTLDGFDMANSENAAAIRLPAGSTIIINGTNALEQNASWAAIALSTGDLAIEGDGTLNITSPNNGGIFVPSGSLEISESTIDIEVKGNGIYTDGDVTITNGDIGILADSWGIYVESGNLTITDGEIDIDASEAGMFAAAGNITISDGTIISHSDESSGIQATGNFSMEDGALRAEGDDYGISVGGNFSMDDGTIEIIGDENAMSVTGSVPNTGLTIKGWGGLLYNVDAAFTSSGTPKVIQKPDGGNITRAKITVGGDDDDDDTDTIVYRINVNPSHRILTNTTDTATFTADFEGANANDITWTTDLSSAEQGLLTFDTTTGQVVTVTTTAASEPKIVLITASFTTEDGSVYKATSTLEIIPGGLIAPDGKETVATVLTNQVILNTLRTDGALVPVSFSQKDVPAPQSMSVMSASAIAPRLSAFSTGGDGSTLISEVVLQYNKGTTKKPDWRSLDEYFTAEPYAADARYIQVKQVQGMTGTLAKGAKQVRFVITPKDGTEDEKIISSLFELKPATTYPKITVTAESLDLFYYDNTAHITAKDADGNEYAVTGYTITKNVTLATQEGNDGIKLANGVTKTGSVSVKLTLNPIPVGATEGYTNLYKKNASSNPGGNQVTATVKIVDTKPKVKLNASKVTLMSGQDIKLQLLTADKRSLDYSSVKSNVDVTGPAGATVSASYEDGIITFAADKAGKYTLAVNFDGKGKGDGKASTTLTVSLWTDPKKASITSKTKSITVHKDHAPNTLIATVELTSNPVNLLENIAALNIQAPDGLEVEQKADNPNLITIKKDSGGDVAGKIIITGTVGNVNGVDITKKVEITVKEVTKTAAVSVSLKNKIDITNKNTEIIATAKLTNTTSPIESVKLYPKGVTIAPGNESGDFEATITDGSNVFTIKPTEFGKLKPGTKYELVCVIELENDQTPSKAISITPVQGKAKAWQNKKAVTLYTGAPKTGEEIALDFSTPEWANIGYAQVEAKSNTATKLVEGFELVQNGKNHWVLKFKDGEKPVPVGKAKIKNSYTVKLELWPEGAYQTNPDGSYSPWLNAKGNPASKPVTVSVKVNVKG